MKHIEAFMLPLHVIQPSQLYICREKYLAIPLNSVANFVNVHSPLPIIELEGDVIFTDGHTRALVAYQAGISTIPVFYDSDHLDLLAYAQCAQWCKAEGIFTIMDLQERIIPFEAFKRLWIDRCQKLRTRTP